MRSTFRVTRCTRWLCLVGYVLVASGLPLPVGTAPAGNAGGRSDRIAAGRLAGKDRSRAFPCMDKPCGCATAEQCFTSCCCHTPAESLAWARAHDVDPAVLASLERRVAASLPQATGCCSTTKTTKASSCCDEKPAAETAAVASCCAAEATPALPAAGCCEMAGQPALDAPDEPAMTTDDHTPVEPTITSVVLRAMLACGGIAAEWFAASGALPPPLVTLPAADMIVAAMPMRHCRTVTVPVSPDTPPPRVG